METIKLDVKKVVPRGYTGQVEWSNGRRDFYEDGVLHAEHGPAVLYACGSTEHWVKGKRHREDGPATSFVNGYYIWYVDGKRHRIDGPAVIKYDGTKLWYLNDRLMPSEEAFREALAHLDLDPRNKKG